MKKRDTTSRTIKLRILVGGGIALALYFLLCSFYIIALPAPSLLRGKSEIQLGINELVSNPASASAHFATASTEFRSTIDALRSTPFGSPILTPLPPFRWEVSLTKAATYLADAGTTASALAQAYPATTKSDDINALLSQNSSGFFSWYETNQTSFSNLQHSIDLADDELSGVPDWIFLTHRTELSTLKNSVHTLRVSLAPFQNMVNQLHKTLGSTDASGHTISILFQNDAELRPTGGFIGSFATLVASGGVIRQFHFGEDVYKLDHLYNGTDGPLITPPDQLRTMVAYQSYRDANVGASFLPQSSGAIQTLLAKATSSPPEGIIYIDSTILEDLLTVTGPIDVPGFPTAITAENVSDQLTNAVEVTYFKDPANVAAMEPKQVLNNLIPLLISHLQHTPGALDKIATNLRKEIDRKSLQFWALDPSFENTLSNAQPLDSPTDGNWLKIVNTNLGGMKSSRSVKESITVSQHEDVANHQLIQQVDVQRTHGGTSTWPDGTNKNYVELYIPSNATIISTPQNVGGDTDKSPSDLKALGIFDKVWTPTILSTDTYKRIGMWETVAPGKTLTYTVVYSLPLSSTNEYHFTFIKQAGAHNQMLTIFDKQLAVNGNIFVSK